MAWAIVHSSLEFTKWTAVFLHQDFNCLVCLLNCGRSECVSICKIAKENLHLNDTSDVVRIMLPSCSTELFKGHLCFLE